jgi:hypothetical protein
MPQPRSRAKSEPPEPPRHPFIDLLSGREEVPDFDPDSAFPSAHRIEDHVSFVGFVSGWIERPGTDTRWLLMYPEAQPQSWLLLEGSGIVHTGTMANEVAPEGPRNVVWVRRDAAVGTGSGPQSDEARFLTGEFTRAGDFYAAPAGGTNAASTGVFCGGNTAFCCRRPSQG